MKTRWPLSRAQVTAALLIEQLEGSCERVDIAGSVRRGREDVGDIELLCIPRMAQDLDLFGDVAATRSLLDQRCLELVRTGVLDYRRNAQGLKSFGPLNKLMVHSATGIPVDIFATTQENWGMALVVRTGPADFNVRIMTRFRDLGLRGHAYGGVTLPTGEIVHCPTEKDVFRHLGWDYLEPQNRR